MMQLVREDLKALVYRVLDKAVDTGHTEVLTENPWGLSTDLVIYATELQAYHNWQITPYVAEWQRDR